MCLGAMGLILYTYPWLGFAFVALGFLLVSRLCQAGDIQADPQYLTAIFYRQSSREIKRLDSILRSPVYAAFGEQVVLNLVSVLGK